MRLKDEVEPFSNSEIWARCRNKIVLFKIPEHVISVNDFSRTLSEKIQKFKFMEVFKERQF